MNIKESFSKIEVSKDIENKILNKTIYKVPKFKLSYIFCSIILISIIGLSLIYTSYAIEKGKSYNTWEINHTFANNYKILVGNNLNFKKICMMVQKEVGNRFCASPGSREYGSISVFLSYFYDVKKYNGITTTIFTSVQKAFQFKYANDISTALSNIQQEFNAKYIDQEPERVAVVINSTADLLNKEIEIEPINGASIGTNVNQIWETSEEMSLINNDKIIFIPHLPVGSSKTYLQNGSNKYEVLTADGHDFNTSTSQGRLKTTNDLEDILVLKYSDRRIYVQKIITKENDQKYWKKTIFGNYAQALEQLLQYEGDVQIGALFTINIYGALRNFRIYNIDTRTYMTFDDEKINALTGAYLQDGDLIELNTIKGNKYVRLKRGNEYYSLLNCINNDADWFQLNVGDNIYTYLANDNSLLSMTVQYRTALIGI